MKKWIAGLLATGTLGGGTLYGADQAINPYTDRGDKLEIASQSTINAAGENKVEVAIDRPAVTLKKWNGETALTVSYDKVKGEGKRKLLTDRIEWKDGKEEVHAYPLPPGEGMEDGGFEIEVVLNQIPETNVFEFHIEGAEDLDFFYQPTLTDEEIAHGDRRPENVVGSYAVYHKEKSNHQAGQINYATGKAYHIFRPKAIDALGLEMWADLSYIDGVLSVAVPQTFLDNATYPVRVDPTFGYTTIGGTDHESWNQINCKNATSTVGTLDSMSFYGYELRTGSMAYSQMLYITSSKSRVVELDGSFDSATPAWRDITAASQALTNVNHQVCVWHGAFNASGNMHVYRDTAGETTGTNYWQDITYAASSPNPLAETGTHIDKYSVYATYTETPPQVATSTPVFFIH